MAYHPARQPNWINGSEPGTPRRPQTVGFTDDGLADDDLEAEMDLPSRSSSGASKDLRVSILGVPLHHVMPSERAQMVTVSLTVLVASVSFAALQERVLYVPGFKYTGWMAIVTSLTYVACACTERMVVGEPRRLGPMVDYIKLSIMTMGGMYLTNWSLRYLTYPLRVVFKSSKLIPVMLLSVAYLKKKYTVTQYISVSLLSTGVVIFTLGDAKGKASFDPRGIGVIALGSFLEALASNFEEQRLFNQLGCPATEVVLYSSLIGCVWAVVADALTGDLFPAMRHSNDHPETIAIIAVAALAGYVATSGVLVLIKHFGATLAEIVKCCRKILTICISFILYEKQLTRFHVVGCLLFAASFSVERAAAGGTSRRLAGLPMLASIVLLCSASGASTWSVVIDAGSMGSRVNIFRFDGWTSQLRDIGGEAQVWVPRDPGIGAFLRNVSGLRASLQPLLDVAVAKVPGALRAATPLAVRATGLRLLPKLEVEALLAEVRRILVPYGFEDAGVQALDEEEEAECEWLTVNFLMGTFRPGVQHVRDPVAVIDLAGDSVQIAYFMHDKYASKAKGTHRETYVRKLVLPFGSGYANLYQHSYLGHGLMTARKASFRALDQGRHPCLPTGEEVIWQHHGEEFRGLGACDTAKCASLAEKLLQLGKWCGGDEPCSFNGVWGGPGFGRLVLKSYFYERMDEAGSLQASDPNATFVANFTQKAQESCNASADGLKAVEVAFPRVPPETRPWLCFDLSYMAALLSKGFRLEPGRRARIVKKLFYDGREFEASWALGMSIKSTKKIAR